jgi:hypothetical protein
VLSENEKTNKSDIWCLAPGTEKVFDTYEMNQQIK